MRSEIIAASFISGLLLFCKNHPGILIVIVGVAGEIICEWDREKGVRGRLIKMFGMFLIMGLIVEIWEAAESDEKVANVIADNLRLEARLKDEDPLNAPINSVSATVRLTVKGVKRVQQTQAFSGGIFEEPDLASAGIWGMGEIVFFEGTNTSRNIYHLSCGGENFQFVGGAFIGETNEEIRGVVIKLHEDILDELISTNSFTQSNSFDIGKPAGEFRKVGSFMLSLPPMSTNVSVVRGVVELKVNSLRWKFPIPAQKQQFGLMTSQIVTNAANQTEARIWRVPIADWAIPPRFTNRIFTGE